MRRARAWQRSSFVAPFFAIAALTVAACAEHTDGAHAVPPELAARARRVMIDKTTPGPRCAPLGAVQADARYGFVYDADSALAGLRLQAAEMQANYVRVDVVASRRRSGTYRGTAFRCPEPDLDLQGNPLLQSRSP